MTNLPVHIAVMDLGAGFRSIGKGQVCLACLELCSRRESQLEKRRTVQRVRGRVVWVDKHEVAFEPDAAFGVGEHDAKRVLHDAKGS